MVLKGQDALSQYLNPYLEEQSTGKPKKGRKELGTSGEEVLLRVLE